MNDNIISFNSGHERIDVEGDNDGDYYTHENDDDDEEEEGEAKNTFHNHVLNDAIS
jgi:hypothetical protein